MERSVSNHYLVEYGYVALFILAGVILIGGMLAISRLMRPSNPEPVKLEPYECGNIPIGLPWVQMHVHYYILALIFLVFDIETVFLFPWAVVMRKIGVGGFVAMVSFLAVLGIGLVYAWKRGDLEWA